MRCHRDSTYLTEFVTICRTLSPGQRKAVRMMLIHELYQKNESSPPVTQIPTRFLRFAVISSLLSFALLLTMPVHPMAIPAAFGGGLSIALIFT